MMQRSFVVSLSSLVILTLFFSGVASLHTPSPTPPGDAPMGFPPPTQHILREEAEKENRLKREEWIESLHWAAPGTDWRMIEQANRQALALQRQALVEQGVRTDTWTEIGSANLAGRTHATAYSPTDGSLYVGSDGGGIWKGTITGEHWQAISDAIGLGSHGLLVSPGEPEVLLTITNGGTVHATTNGGETWFVPEGLPEYLLECIRILRDPAQPRTVYLLVRAYAYVDDHGIAGWHILRSTDGGQSFEVSHSVSGYANRCDIWIDRVNPGPLYLMVRNVLWMSTDYGDTFTHVGSAPDVGSDVILTASEAGAPTFYAALNISGQWKLYRSTDGGVSWSWRHNINDFWLTLVASITNPNLVLYAGVECFRSVNGGLGFAKVNNWWDYYDDPLNKLHADHPGGECMMIDDQEVFFLDTDGGTYVSYDGVATVQNISLYSLGISQYYSILTSRNDPYLIAAGSQDQGYQVSLPEGGGTYLNFIQHISGDYGHLTSTAHDHNYLYCVYPGFTLLQVSEEHPENLATIDFPPDASYGWMPFILADTQDPDIFYFCADHLWKFERTTGTSYTRTELPQDFSPGYLTGLAISQVDPNYWYAVTSLGKLWYSRNAGQTWTLSASQGPNSHYFYGTALITSPTDRSIAYAGGSGYSGPAVYKTTDGGVSWTPMGGGLPSTLVFGLVFDNDVDQNLYAAAEAGAYQYDTDAGAWQDMLGTEAPLTRYWCLESVPGLEVIRFGTYGRGIWDYQIPNPASTEETGLLASGSWLRIAPNPASVQTTVALELAKAGPVAVEVFDVTGRRRATLVRGERAAGRYDFAFDLVSDRGHPLENGIYLVRMTTPGGVAVEKLHVVR